MIGHRMSEYLADSQDCLIDTEEAYSENDKPHGKFSPPTEKNDGKAEYNQIK